MRAINLRAYGLHVKGYQMKKAEVERKRMLAQPFVETSAFLSIDYSRID
jgi:hypothetical protein